MMDEDGETVARGGGANAFQNKEGPARSEPLLDGGERQPSTQPRRVDTRRSRVASLCLARAYCVKVPMTLAIRLAW